MTLTLGNDTVKITSKVCQLIHKNVAIFILKNDKVINILHIK